MFTITLMACIYCSLAKAHSITSRRVCWRGPNQDPVEVTHRRSGLFGERHPTRP